MLPNQSDTEIGLYRQTLINEAIISGAQEFNKAIHQMTDLSTEALHQEIHEITAQYDVAHKDQIYSIDKIKKAIHEIQQETPKRQTLNEQCIQSQVVLTVVLITIAIISESVNLELAVSGVDVLETIEDNQRNPESNSIFINKVVNDIAENLRY